MLSSPPSKKKKKVPRINQVTKNYFWKERWTVTRKKTKQNICFVSKTIHLSLYVGCTDREKPEYINHTFLLGSQFPYVHDQPLAVVLVVNRLHLHHCGLDPGFILSDKQIKKTPSGVKRCTLEIESLVLAPPERWRKRQDWGLLHMLTDRHTDTHTPIFYAIYITNLLETCNMLAPSLPRERVG